MGWLNLLGGGGGGNDASYDLRELYCTSAFCLVILNFQRHITMQAGGLEPPLMQVCKKGGMALLMFDNLLR